MAVNYTRIVLLLMSAVNIIPQNLTFSLRDTSPNTAFRKQDWIFESFFDTYKNITECLLCSYKDVCNTDMKSFSFPEFLS